MGRIATILFAHRLGTSLEPECKMYRLAADFFNDAAMILDCLSPALPKVSRVILLSFSSVLRSLCGVAAGSSKASLSAHFATQGNLGELNAKDSSQETIISLLGMLAGSLVVSRIASTLATWVSLIFLLSIHLATNYLAVRAVSMRTLNRQRANIVFTTYLVRRGSNHSAPPSIKDCLPDPDEVSQLERIFERDGVLRWNGMVVARCSIGVPFKDLLDILAAPNSQTGSYKESTVIVDDILAFFDNEDYIIWYDATREQFIIVLKASADTRAQLKSWLHVLLFWMKLEEGKMRRCKEPDRLLSCLSAIRKDIQDWWDEILPMMVEKGWDVENGALETRSGTRIQVAGSKKN
ncbi:MAG: hypothetical protein M1818_006707 [Claussenomyces sp. TS43310]|nr:MAG: hypothetical protein M1818_006707 [Claussenomyces sp. TS43310]